MADETNGPDEAVLSAIARHALHDEELIAAFAADDVDAAADTERARALVDRCPTCRDLHRDLVGIRAAIRASGSAEARAATLSAPRDFRLTADDAVRLRPGTPLARLGARLGLRERLGLGIVAFGRPVGAAMATFGIVGLLVGSLTLGSAGFGMTAMPAAASNAPGAGYQRASESPDDKGVYAPLATGEDRNQELEARDLDAGERGPWPILLLGASAAVLVLGVALVLASRRNPARAR